MTPAQIKALIALLLLIGVVAGAYFGVSAYNNAIESNALLAQQVKQYEQTALEQGKTIKRLEAAAKTDAVAAKTKTVERQKAADTLVKDTKEYHREISKAPQTDIDCARRTVPPAVDRLLTD